MVLVVGNNGSTSGLPELEEDVDPVEENIGELSTEGQVLEEEGDEGGLHIGVLHPKLVVNKVLKKGGKMKLRKYANVLLTSHKISLRTRKIRGVYVF